MSALRPLAVGIVACCLCMPLQAAEPERHQAKRLHDRIAGVPPDSATLTAMENDLLANDPITAANRALEHEAFYNVTLKNFATPWSNREQSHFTSLNDYTATVIGMVRDEVPFNELLSADLVYVGKNSLGLPAYSMSNNNHYEQMELNGVDMKDGLQATTQSAVTDLPASATAGVQTTRGAAEAFFILGTNRAMFRFTLLNHLCVDMEQVADTTRPPDRIRQDVTRSPGGDSRIFLNNCIGCHSGMDPLAQAYAYYNYNEDSGRIEYTEGQVHPKYHINETNFPFGYVTPDDRWDNYWREGPNQFLGWDAGLPGSGNGAKSLGEELANSDAFAECQVKKVFQAMCLRAPADADSAQIDTTVTNFQSGGYNLKEVFAELAVYCMGD